MSSPDPTTDQQVRFGSPDASPTPWGVARQHLEEAEVYWLATVRPDGQPHVTSLLAVWLDGALHVCTGADERKARNLAENPRATITTGTNALHEGIDVVVESEAVRVTDEDVLRRLADLWEKKYGGDWRFEVEDALFKAEGSAALVFRLGPTKAFAFSKDPYSQTRYTY